MSRSREVQDLFDQFLTLDGASQLSGFIRSNKPEALAAIEARGHPFGRAAIGAVFELFGYDDRKRNRGGNHLTTPRVTLALYSRLTGLPIVVQPVGNDTQLAGIQGISVPDGIEFYQDAIRRIIALHEYKAAQNPAFFDRQASVLLNHSSIQSNLGLRGSFGQEKAGRALGNLIGNGDSTPIILDINYEVCYTAPQNSVLRSMNLPSRVRVNYLPIHTMILGELLNVIIEESLAGTIGIPKSPRVLPQLGSKA